MDAEAAAELQLERAEERERLPESWVMLLHGKSINHIRHYSYNLMTYVDTSEASKPKENLFLYDLSDLHRHPSWDPELAWSWRQVGATPEGGVLPGKREAPQMTIRYQVDEQDVSAYVDALKDEGFDVQWFTSNPDTVSSRKQPDMSSQSRLCIQIQTFPCEHEKDSDLVCACEREREREGKKKKGGGKAIQQMADEHIPLKVWGFVTRQTHRILCHQVCNSNLIIL